MAVIGNPRFSILVPAFKKQFLAECIESILEQDCNDFEIVIVNDASPYDLDSVVECYDDERINYHKNDVGCGGKNVVDNWNKCLEYSKGEYIICMGDDDKLSPNCLQDYEVAITQNPEIDIFHIRTEMIDEQSSVVDLQEERPLRESVYSMIYGQWKGRKQFIGDFLFRSSVLKAMGGFVKLPFAWSSDKLTTYIVAGDKGIVNVPSVGFQYRYNNSTISNNDTVLREKYEALFFEKQWYAGFWGQLKAEKTAEDKVLSEKLRQELVGYMDGRLCGLLYWDLGIHPVHLFYWMSKSIKYGFSVRDVLRMVSFTLSNGFGNKHK